MSKRKSDDSDCVDGSGSKKAARSQTFLDRYTKFPGIKVSKLGNSHAYCAYCQVDFSIAKSGKFDIERHCGRKRHQDRAKMKQAALGSLSIETFMPKKTLSADEQDTVRADAMFTELIVKMNLPLSTADVISHIVKKAFPDSTIAQKFSCGRTKTTAIVKTMAADIKSVIKRQLVSGPFCVSTDGSNDQRNKQYPVVITTVTEHGVTTELLSVPTLDIQSPSTGENIFKLVEEQLKVAADSESDQSHYSSVPWHNCLALGSDNAAVMSGHKNGVFGKMKEKQQSLYFSGCPCHLIHRAAQKAASQLPFNVDEILVDVYFYFEHSSKRLAALERFQEGIKHQKVLKHVATRWLSIRQSLGRVLENWDALKVFFQQDSAEASTSSAQCRQERLKTFFRSPTNRLYCLFLHDALHSFDIINQRLQCESPQVHTLRRSLQSLMRELLVKFVKPVVIAEPVRDQQKSRPKTVLEIDFKNPSNHKNIVVLSAAAESFLSKKEENHLREEKIKEFHAKTKKFYVAACTYMKDKFPLQEELLKNAEIADIDLRLQVSDSQLSYFLKRFPCLLPADCTTDQVKSEFCSYQSHPIIPNLKKERMDSTWLAIRQAKDEAGICLFQNIATVMLGILTIPHSNASCERVFSCVRKNKTDQRASLSAKTLESLMVVKSKPGMPHERDFTMEQLKRIKSACYKENKPASATSEKDADSDI